MSDSTHDQNSVQERIDRLKAIAAGIFARHGVDFSTAKRAGGWTNATWLAGGLALRLSVESGRESLRREAKLAALLPPAVGYPTIVETGVTGGHEWGLARAIPGENLEDAWPGLSWEERVAALRQLWKMVEAVHSVDVSGVESLARKRAWYNSTDPVLAAGCLARLQQQGILSAEQAEILSEELSRFWKSLPSAACVLNHGDLTHGNCLWSAGRLVSLIDFEFAVIAPPELDWNGLLKWAFGPLENGGALPGADNAGLRLMREAAAGLVTPALAQPGSKRLLLGYAILLELWMLDDWLAHPEGEGPLETWEPYRRLLSLADGGGGYLAPVLST
jgi:scyllo-inosamine 4-kinase